MDITKVLKNILDENNKIKIPDWVKKIKLDIGTSLSAPNSEIWLQRENDLMVFGFEPNIHNIKILHEGQNYWPHHIKKERIDNSFFLVNCGLSNERNESQKFYCTGDNNSGTSSLFKPKTFEVLDTIDIPVITLNDFFDLFPWDKINVIDQIKIDAQSSDFNIIKGMDRYMCEKVIYIDVETNTNGQYYSEESPMELKNYMIEKNFECVNWGINATFLNKKFKDISDKVNYHTLDM
jgi:FkbM family methyltransferase